MQIDVVIPVALKDIPKLQICIENIVKYSQTPIRHIYIISETPVKYFSINRNIEWISEDNYPFTSQGINEIFHAKGCNYDHGSWYYQQLLKFYAFKIIPDMLPNILILDSDYVFTHNIKFLTNAGKAILAYGYPFKWLLNTKEYPYPPSHVHIDFARRFIDDWYPVNVFSGMQHHMLLQKDVVETLFAVVEEKYQMNSGWHLSIALHWINGPLLPNMSYNTIL